MRQSLDFYNDLDWWNPSHSLLQTVPVKSGYFMEKIEKLEGARILDIGCGGGLVAEQFAKRGANVTGLDLSEGALRTARDHAAASGLHIHYERGPAEELPFGDGLFDAVVCADCLEHVDDLERVIAQVSRVLRSGGVFCYDTVNRNLWSKLLVAWIGDRLLRRELRRLGVEGMHVVHDWRKFIKPEELVVLLDRHGLRNQETRGLQLAGFRKGVLKLKIGKGTRLTYLGYAVKCSQA
jgi:2-polyprenyl-6-hydroxyphenyl methylase/3-demethylubiquinone-9 3-methyltransferase